MNQTHTCPVFHDEVLLAELTWAVEAVRLRAPGRMADGYRWENGDPVLSDHVSRSRSATRPWSRPRRARPIVRFPRPLVGPMVGLGEQVAVLMTLTLIGISPAGWLLGFLYGLAVTGLLARGLVRSGQSHLGPANHVTLARSALVGGVLALVVSNFGSQTPVAVLVTLATVALVLDGVDGKVARRTSTASALGAKFDREVDAMLILILSVNAGRYVGWWVLMIGAARFLFLAAGLIWPWLRGDLPARYWAKVVAVIQGVVLTIVAAGILPVGVLIALCVIALAALAESFGRSIWWLAAHRHPKPSAWIRAASPRPSRLDG